jgi:ribosomal protein L19
MKSLLPMLLAIGGCVIPVFAQEQTPVALYHKNLADSVSLTKNYVYKTKPDETQLTEAQKKIRQFLDKFPKLDHIEIVQTGNLRRDKQYFLNGNTIEIWRTGDKRLLIDSTNPSYVAVNTAGENYQDEPDFPELDWIASDCLKGTQDLNGISCQIYQSGGQTAWINQSTLLPVALETNDLQITYTFKNPSSPLQLPAELKKKLEQPARVGLQKITPPSPLYKKVLSGNLTFTKKYIYKTSSSSPEEKAAQQYLSRFPKIEQITVVQSGTLRKDEQKLLNNSTIEVWRSGNTRFTVYSTSPNYIAVNFVDVNYQDSPDFAELGWITTASLQGLQIRAGIPCYVYQLGDSSAWVDKNSLMPIYYESKDMQIFYTYDNPPDTPLKLPAKFLAKLDEIKGLH